MSSWALKEFMDCASVINDDQGKAVPVAAIVCFRRRDFIRESVRMPAGSAGWLEIFLLVYRN